MLPELTILFVVLGSALACRSDNEAVVADQNWWKTAAFYQIYPRSFMDSDGDGVGDLNGITSKLDHLADAGIDAFWLSPIYTSPMADFGYDIANFTDVDPVFGNLDEFDKLVARAKELKLKVILDFVPNHSSDEHPWFQNSIKRIYPYTDYYVWQNGTTDETGYRHPPNNWLSTFRGSAWEWNEERGQFYLHQFAKGQPDLNYRNELLRQEMEDALTFWLKRGVEGFRIDALNHMFEDAELRDEPSANNPNVPDDYYDSLDHIYSKNQNETYVVLQSWRNLLDKYSEKTGTDNKVLLVEAYVSMEMAENYYNHGSVPFNFYLITDARKGSTATEIKNLIDNWLGMMPKGQTANWVVGNHDQRRVASRYGVDRADQMSIVCSILPGIAVSYNGDEIGMLDGDISWEESVDPAACNTDSEHFQSYTRDPERTPYQWDNTANAGFTTGETTWLPVNPDYTTLNLKAQKEVAHSHYHVYKAMMALRKIPILKRGYLIVDVLSENVLVIARTVGDVPPVIALVNCGDTSKSVNLQTSLTTLDQMTIYTSSVYSQIIPGTNVTTGNVVLPGASTVVLTSARLYQILKTAS